MRPLTKREIFFSPLKSPLIPLFQRGKEELEKGENLVFTPLFSKEGLGEILFLPHFTSISPSLNPP